MTTFSTSIHQVVTCALSELTEAQLKGKLPPGPLNETHFLAAWTTSAMKKKRFESDVLPTLKIWQRKARSLGKDAGLVGIFKAIKTSYEHIFNEDLTAKPVNKTQVISLCEKLVEQQWMVKTDLEVGEKLNRHSGGQASMVICSNEFDAHFEEGQLIKPISVYIRGNVTEALQTAFDNSLLLYKITDYKSKVKYHGEYIIYANNDGKFLPELLGA